MPTVCMKTTSTSKARNDSGSSITEPPSLMTVNLPWNFRMKPIASINTSALRMASSCTAPSPRIPKPATLSSKLSIFLIRTVSCKDRFCRPTPPLPDGRASLGGEGQPRDLPTSGPGLVKESMRSCRSRGRSRPTRRAGSSEVSGEPQ